MEGHTANTARRAVAGPTTPCRMAFGALPALVFYADRGMAGGAGDYRLPRSVFRKKTEGGSYRKQDRAGGSGGPATPCHPAIGAKPALYFDAEHGLEGGTGPAAGAALSISKLRAPRRHDPAKNITVSCRPAGY